jgi:predicted TIM-barrel fold metal-dependent hydrolase
MTKEHEAWLALTAEEPIDSDLAICDAHHHLWDRPNDRYLIDDFLKDVGGGHRIVQTVFVECRAMYRKSGPEEMRPVGQTEFVQGVAEHVAHEQHGKIAVASGIVGYADLTLGARVAPVLETHTAASKDRFRGIRHITTGMKTPKAYYQPLTPPGDCY